jgi:hypothetical protein
VGTDQVVAKRRIIEIRLEQLPDAPTDKAAWATYRQALRDLPAQAGLAEEAVFPAQPGGN